MAAGIGVKIKGVRELLSGLGKLSSGVHKAMAVAVAKTAFKVAGDAKVNAPVDTGRLRAGINTEVSTDGLSAIVFDDVEYAAHVEFGHLAGDTIVFGQLFMTRAAEDNQKFFADTVLAEVAKAVEKVK